MSLSSTVSSLVDKLFVIARRYNMTKFTFGRIKNKFDKNSLTNEQKKIVKEFYSDYCKVSTDFHCFYTEKTGVFSEKYIPDDVYFNRVNTYFNDKNLAKVIDNKCYYSLFFPELRQPDKLAERKGGCWFVEKQMVTLEQTVDVLCKEPAIFIKAATSSCGGRGINYVDKKECQDYRKCIKEGIEHVKGDIIVQKPIIQHSDFGKLNESSVNTLRILSILRNGEVKIYSSIVRIGVAGSKVDNACSGGMSVGITEEGKLKEYAYYSDGDKIARHPSSGFVFKDYQLPSFDKAMEMVKKAHFCLPHFKMISWDIAIDEDGEPVLIEVNLTYGEISFHQFNNGPLFGEDTREILDEVFGK